MSEKIERVAPAPGRPDTPVVADTEAVKQAARAILNIRGFGFYIDPNEAGIDAYEITLQALADAAAALSIPYVEKLTRERDEARLRIRVTDQLLESELTENAELKARVERLEAALTQLTVERDDLRKLVYVPGLWRCAKCKFQLMQANLNADDGSVTARDETGDKCPNCNSPLWRVTERQAGNDMVDRCEEQMERAKAAEAALKEAREHVRHAPTCATKGRDEDCDCGAVAYLSRVAALSSSDAPHND